MRPLFILTEAVKLESDDFGNVRYVGRPKRLHDWRESRNTSAHTVVYTVPTKKSYGQEFDAFMRSAEECAHGGQEIVRHLTDWNRMGRAPAHEGGAVVS